MCQRDTRDELPGALMCLSDTWESCRKLLGASRTTAVISSTICCWCDSAAMYKRRQKSCRVVLQPGDAS